MRSPLSILCMLCTAFAMAVAGCSSGDIPLPASRDKVILSLGVQLGDILGNQARSAEEEAKEGEIMKSLRVIVLDAEWHVEHNSYFSFDNPVDRYTDPRFPVKANQLKTVILVANEHAFSVGDPESGAVTPASEVFSALSAAIGEYVDVSQLQKLEVPLAANADASGCLRRDLPIAGIFTCYIGTEDTEAVFRLHRAATKYTYRIKNMSGRGRTITGVHLSHSASTEYLFPDADYSDKEMTHISAYRVPADAKSSEFTYDCSVSLADGQSVELPPIYQLEGVATTDAAPYSTTISTEGVMLAWRPIQWRLQESSMPLRLMTDLPRNTHVVVNILLKDQNDIALEVILVPYRGVNLDPGFGLD